MIKEVELIGIDVFLKQNTIKSYEKLVKIIKDDQEMYALLDYDDYDGYSINWMDENYKEVEEPAWATKYAEATSYHELAYLLDEMGQK